MTTWKERGEWLERRRGTISILAASNVQVCWVDECDRWHSTRDVTIECAIDAAMAECARLEAEARKPKPGILAEAIVSLYGEVGRDLMRTAIKRQCDEWRKITDMDSPDRYMVGLANGLLKAIHDLEAGL